MRLQAFTISFVLAFLLFAVQPMATKMVLPTLGGTPAVWNTVMFTFQVLLLLGYCYAHLLTRTFKTRGQIVIHTALIIATFLFLPLSVQLSTSDALVNNPILYLLKAFLLQLGLPFFCLAATAPLLQSWVSRSPHPLSKTPYVLYSASNLGSFAGLLGYVAIVEPLLDLREQSFGWSLLYIAGTAALILMAKRLRAAPLEKQEAIDEIKPTWKERGTWMWLAFLPSSLSLGVTTYIATDVASVPLLWVIPLSLYLLSFVDAFRAKPRLVALSQRYAPLFGLMALAFYAMVGVAFAGVYLFQLLVFAILALAIHGWLASRQPSTRYLTQFYVCLSIGGAFGGVLNGLIAPLVFRSSFEYPLVLLIACVTSFMLMRSREEEQTSVKPHLQMAIKTLVAVLLGAIGIYSAIAVITHAELLPLEGRYLTRAAALSGLAVMIIYRRFARIYYAYAAVMLVILFSVDSGVGGHAFLFKDRNFFGVSRIYDNKEVNARYLLHDTTLHGLQSLDPKRSKEPVAYYAALGEVFRTLPVMHEKPLAIIGLGVGILKCFAVPHQPVDLYEINPIVKMLAENPAYFTYLRDCPGDGDILMGDGRIRIGGQPDHRYGAIIIDAFSSDAIPSHLLTKEALAMYGEKLAPGGVLVLHITNRHIDLWPLLGAQIEALGYVGYGKHFSAQENNPLILRSVWVVIAMSEKTLQPLIRHEKGWEKLDGQGHRPWTDQYINLLPYMKALQ